MKRRMTKVLTVCVLWSLACSVGCNRSERSEGGERVKEKEVRAAKEKEAIQVKFSYMNKPTMELPAGIKTVAVLNSETKDDADRKWSMMAADMISGLLDEAVHKHGAKIVMADRQNIAKIIKEKDLALAGITEGAKLAEAGKLLNAQGLIYSTITVKVEKHVGKGRTISGANIQRWVYGSGAGVQTEEIEKVSRNITVLCKFSLVDATNGKILLNRVSPVLRKTDQTKTSVFFGASKTEAELTPEDRIVGELVEAEARRFIGSILPTEMETVVSVFPSKHPACKSGVRLLASGEYAEAIRMFETALAEVDGKDRYALFGKGVALEAMGKLDDALKIYREAVIQDSPGAEDALQRVKLRQNATGGADK